MTRPLVVTLALAALLGVSPAAAVREPEPAKRAHGERSWAQAQIRRVVAAGLMGDDVASFRPRDVLTQGELRDLVAGLTKKPAGHLANRWAPASVALLDARLVVALGLEDAARRFQRAAERARLRPPSRFGTEVVARLLGLRKNHPAARDRLELLPTDPVTRAEAAYSAARILGFDGSQVEAVEVAAASFSVPALTVWQRRVLRTAFSVVGYPYVWGGSSESPAAPFGVQSRGGFDCSGFVWRVFKHESYPGGGALGETLRGRTTYVMSAEAPAKRRIPLPRLAPADVVFFGAGGPRSQPDEVDHMGIYVGNGWLVHSSRYGVALAPLSDRYREQFAWARRPLAEAGLR